MVKLGFFKLYSAVVSPLVAGDYKLTGELRLSGSSDGRESSFETEKLESHLRVASPRFHMPPEQILSTYPPANSEGNYDERLPQIVLKRRTLPWDRGVEAGEDDDSPRKPWLALVVLAEGEGTVNGPVPVAECVTPGITLGGEPDVLMGRYLEVSQSVIDKVFPTEKDLHLLCHVREVNLDDTELALGDDDGFLAVVLANRLPLYDRENCQPVRYTACLINLEGQTRFLPRASDPSSSFTLDFSVLQTLARAGQLSFDPDHALGGGRPALTGSVNQPTVMPKASAKASVAAWSKRPATGTVKRASNEILGKLAHRGTNRFEALDPKLRPELFNLSRRFPVLAKWSFTCNGVGGFDTYMKSLHVGLLGTEAPPARERDLPPCAPEPQGTPPPEPPSPRPPPEFAETGHVGLPHLTRLGQSVRAWYRGPLVAHATQRQRPDAEGRLPLAHVSDQLRRVLPDLREDLTYAAAFEIGRLLALSQPSVVSSLMAWRRQRFTTERVQRFVLRISDGLRELLNENAGRPWPQVGASMAKRFVRIAGEDPRRFLAPSRPLADPGRRLDFGGRSLENVLSGGFGIPAAEIGQLQERLGVDDTVGLDAFEALDRVRIERADTAEALDARGMEHLRGALEQHLEGVLGGWTDFNGGDL